MDKASGSDLPSTPFDKITIAMDGEFAVRLSFEIFSADLGVEGTCHAST